MRYLIFCVINEMKYSIIVKAGAKSRGARGQAKYVELLVISSTLHPQRPQNRKVVPRSLQRLRRH